MNESNNLKTLNHHRQQELCTTRPAYRQGRKLTAVKVVRRFVPELNVTQALIGYCFGSVVCVISTFYLFADLYNRKRVPASLYIWSTNSKSSL